MKQFRYKSGRFGKTHYFSNCFEVAVYRIGKRQYIVETLSMMKVMLASFHVGYARIQGLTEGE